MKGADFRYGQHTKESIAESRLTAIENEQKAVGDRRDTARYEIVYVIEPDGNTCTFSNASEGNVCLERWKKDLGLDKEKIGEVGKGFDAKREALRQLPWSEEQINDYLAKQQEQPATKKKLSFLPEQETRVAKPSQQEAVSLLPTDRVKLKKITERITPIIEKAGFDDIHEAYIAMEARI